jgi:hypothetical protein
MSRVTLRPEMVSKVRKINTSKNYDFNLVRRIFAELRANLVFDKSGIIKILH